MHFNQLYIIIISILGFLLLLSYGYYIQNDKKTPQLWGKIKGNLLNIYYASMILSAIGFLLLFWFLIKSDAFNETNSKNLFIALLGIILFSMLWMPFSLEYIKTKSNVYKYLVLSVLFMVAFSSFMTLVILYNIKDNSKLLALLGMLYFFIHVFFFDFIIWSYNVLQ